MSRFTQEVRDFYDFIGPFVLMLTFVFAGLVGLLVYVLQNQ